VGAPEAATAPQPIGQEKRVSKVDASETWPYDDPLPYLGRRRTVNALPTRIPRAFANHRTPEGAAYRLYCQGKLARLGPLPDDARPLLREAGRITVELDLLGRRRDAIRAFKKPRKLELRQLGSESRKLRVQLLMLERRLDDMAAASPAPHEALAAQYRGT